MKVLVQSRLATLTDPIRVPSRAAGVAAVNIEDGVGQSYGVSGKKFDDEFIRPCETRCSMVMVGKGQGGNQ
jgi:hypothetical protein